MAIAGAVSGGDIERAAMAKAAQGLVQRLVQRGPELIGGEGRRGARGGSGVAMRRAEVRGATAGRGEPRGGDGARG